MLKKFKLLRDVSNKINEVEEFQAIFVDNINVLESIIGQEITYLCRERYLEGGSQRFDMLVKDSIRLFPIELKVVHVRKKELKQSQDQATAVRHEYLELAKKHRFELPVDFNPRNDVVSILIAPSFSDEAKRYNSDYRIPAIFIRYDVSEDPQSKQLYIKFSLEDQLKISSIKVSRIPTTEEFVNKIKDAELRKILSEQLLPLFEQELNLRCEPVSSWLGYWHGTVQFATVEFRQNTIQLWYKSEGKKWRRKKNLIIDDLTPELFDEIKIAFTKFTSSL